MSVAACALTATWQLIPSRQRCEHLGNELRQTDVALRMPRAKAALDALDALGGRSGRGGGHVRVSTT